jgi:hypothetical protein
MENLGDGWAHINFYKGGLTDYAREFPDVLFDIVPQPGGTMNVRPREWDGLSHERRSAIQARLNALPGKIALKAELGKAEDEVGRQERIAQVSAANLIGDNQPQTDTVSAIVPTGETPNGSSHHPEQLLRDGDGQFQPRDMLTATSNGEGSPLPELVGAQQ